MKNFRFNYIITIHNKQDLIVKVLDGLRSCIRENSFVYPILDGCTDNTEKIINEYIKNYPEMSINKVYLPDVHELRSINGGLKVANQSQKGCNIILQDDVIIQDHNLEDMVYKIYTHFGYENIGYLSFRHGVNIYLKDDMEIVEMFKNKSKEIEERDIIESTYGTGMSPKPIPPHMIVERMVTVGSPQCISCYVVNKIGMMDEKLAPVSYSCHDLSLRCLEAGLHNYSFALKYSSEVEWGGTRQSPTPKHMDILERNRHYLYQKHKSFIKAFHNNKEYKRLKLSQPFSIPEIPVIPEKSNKDIEAYYIRRIKGVGLKIHLISKYFKLPLKWVLVHLGLY